MKLHWYYMIHICCPVCGSENIYRERRYHSRPIEYNDRHKFEEQYDWCNA